MCLWLHEGKKKKRGWGGVGDKDNGRTSYCPSPLCWHAGLMKCSIITVNRVFTCKSFGLYISTLIVSNISCQEMDSCQGSTIRGTEADRHVLGKWVWTFISHAVLMQSGDGLVDQGHCHCHCLLTVQYFFILPIPLWSPGQDSAALHCAMQFQPGFPYELNRECSPLIV